MEILIHIRKKKLDPDYAQAIAEYIKRLSPFCRVRICPYKQLPGIGSGSACFRITPGKSTLSSEDFSDQIANLALSGYSRIEYIIGDIPNKLSAPSDTEIHPLSLSGFSMPDDLTAVVLTEQLYRAYTIQNHITYHK